MVDTPESRSRLVAIGFTLLCLALMAWRLTIPSKFFFDEVHYLPAARALIDLSGPVNTEHPLFAKTIIAAGMLLFGDNAFGWRIFPWAFGGLAIFATMRMTWWLARSEIAAFMAGFFVITGQLVFVLSRIAMLDMVMAGCLMAGLWLTASALDQERGNHARLAAAGVLLGLAVGAKWSAAPVAMMAGIGLFAMRGHATGWRPKAWAVESAAPFQGVSLWQAVLLMGLIPFLVYLATFTPAFFYASNPIAPGDILAYQLRIFEHQSNPMPGHTYQSTWWQWLGNIRPIWFLYEQADGAQRGVILLGNPVVMWAGLGGVALCGLIGVMRRDRAMLIAFVLFAVALAPWAVVPKPVQFYYHYLLPSIFLCIALALALERLWWRDGLKGVPVAMMAAAAGLFAWFYPILSAAPLDGEMAFMDWMWLDSWR